jgi:catechol 2,3-dioxygenase-like lactoylglutathione lyase family enzyme
MKCYPIIVVQDVAASSRWYQELLGLTSAHGGDEFEMLMADGDLALCLHRREVDEHPALVVPEGATAGAGVLLYFSVDDVAPVHARALEMGADVLDEPHLNELAGATEFSLRDPNGYALTVSHRG